MESEKGKVRPRVLLTGAGGMLGRYVAAEFEKDCDLTLLGLDSSRDIVCDLTRQAPPAFDETFDLVVHCAGTMDEAQAYSLNYEGTERFLSSFVKAVPKAFVYISSVEVYGKTEGENIDETANRWTVNEVGRSKYLAEESVKKFFKDRDTTVTILRPVTMYGRGVKGYAATLFNRVVSGRYVHVRGNDARRSVVLALDVARVIRAVWQIGGEYNVCDGRDRRLIELAEAMSANAGVFKRMIFLPDKWAGFLSGIADRIPPLREIAGSGLLERLSHTLTFSNSRLREASGYEFFDTVEVIARRDKNYPYEDENC